MAKQRGKTKQVYVNTVISDVQSQLPYHLPINSWNTRGIVGQLLQREMEGGERERETLSGKKLFTMETSWKPSVAQYS